MVTEKENEKLLGRDKIQWTLQMITQFLLVLAVKNYKYFLISFAACVCFASDGHACNMSTTAERIFIKFRIG
jgi:hypothetical protein